MYKKDSHKHLFHGDRAAKLALIGLMYLIFAAVSLSLGGALMTEVSEPPTLFGFE